MYSPSFAHISEQKPIPKQDAENVNVRITRKLDGGRPHKVYDYMFIQMSNEQFKSEYNDKKLQVTKPISNENENTDYN